MATDSPGMDWPGLSVRSLPWAGKPRPAGSPPFVLLVRIFSYRNFAGHPFPVSASPEACLRLAETAADYLARQGLSRTARFSELDPSVLRMLRERHLLPEPPAPLPGRKPAKRLALGADEDFFGWINEVEHLTWVSTWPGLLPAEDFEAVHRPPAEEARLPFARSLRHGLLASDPSRAGSGTVFRMLVHLPAIGLAHKLGQAGAALHALGIGCQPVTRLAGIPFGRRTFASEGSLFWLLSRGSLGMGAGEAYRRFLTDVQPLLRWESELQKGCLEKHRKRLEDRVHGCLRTLSEGGSLPVPDWEKAASLIRLGSYVGILDAQITEVLEGLRARAGSGHLEVSSGRALSKEEEDTGRASVVRLSLEKYRVRA